MRKSIIIQDQAVGSLTPFTPETLIDLEQLAHVWLTSEANDHSIESALLRDSTSGWRAALPGEQIIRLTFDQPLTVKHIRLSFNEQDCSRTQEFVLRWTKDDGTVQEILRQQFHFSPPDTASEIEAYDVNLTQLKQLELSIKPDISNGNAIASLQSLRLW